MSCRESGSEGEVTGGEREKRESMRDRKGSEIQDSFDADT
jgi:hypothetical protein